MEKRTLNQVVFANGFALPVLSFTVDKSTVDNAWRRTITIQVPRDAEGLDTIDEMLCVTENLAKIRNVNTEHNAEDTFENFYKVSLTTQEMLVGENENGGPVTEPQIVIVLAAYTPQEIELRQTQAMMQQILGMMNAGQRPETEGGDQ